MGDTEGHGIQAISKHEGHRNTAGKGLQRDTEYTADMGTQGDGDIGGHEGYRWEHRDMEDTGRRGTRAYGGHSHKRT